MHKSNKNRKFNKNVIQPVRVKYWCEKINGIPCQDLKYAKNGDACCDVRALEDVIIPARSKVVVKTGLHIAIPENYEIQVRPRSGISFKTDLIFKNTVGTIDHGYLDAINIIFYNLDSDDSHNFSAGDRVAQIKLSPVPLVKYERVETLEELKSGRVDRGGGFGHTGLK